MKQVGRLIFFISWLFLSFVSFAQTPFLKPHLLFKGKEKYNVNVIYQDPKGLIWFGTDHGLFKFDGITYTRYTTSEGLAEDKISALNTDHKGNLWVGHFNGEITLYNSNTFNVFTPEEGLGTHKITDIAVDSSGTIWFSTLEEGVYKYDGRYLTNLNSDDGISDNTVYDIEIDASGTIWFATDYGITRYAGNKCDVISMKDGLTDNLVTVIKSSKDGRIWIGTQEKGLLIYDPALKKFTSVEGWDFGAVTGFVMSLEDEIWISTENQGIIQLKLSVSSKPWYKKVTEKQGLISNRISSIIKDHEENIWVGGNQGVVQALPPVFEFLNKSNGTPFNMVYSIIYSSAGNMWVCTESGLYRGVPDNNGQFVWSNLSQQMKLKKINFISLYLDEEGLVWAGTYGNGVFRINPKDLSYMILSITNGLNDNNVSSISGNNGQVWFSTFGGGVSCYSIRKSEIHKYSDPELKNSYVYATKSDNSGKTWIAGTLRQPSYIFKDSLFRITSDSIKFPQFYGLAIDSFQRVWLNTQDEGIIKIDENRISSLNEKNGIGLKKIRSIVFDKLNNLMLVSDFGFLFYNPENGAILEFGENSGLAFQYPLLNSIFTDKEGQIWIGTQNGIIKYNPEYLKFINQNPQVFLSEKNLFSIPIKEGKKKFGYRENNFTFGYTGIWFRNPEGLNYRYMLEGFDLKWNYSTRNQVLPYSQLPSGIYTFKVEVSLNNNDWFSSANSTFSFKVNPPFWQRWWFVLLSVLLLISGILFYIRLRLSNLEKAKKELEQEVYKRTEEIRNQNEELETQKEEIETQRDLAEAQRDQIESQRNEIQASIRYAHRIQSAAFPPKNQLNSILKDYFILNKPRDIVSGDFYWVAENESNFFFAVGDCTGHGVPGSFMSMLGLSALNDIVKSLKTCKASTILNLLRERIRESLHQGVESEAVANDGMDISLCIFDKKSNHIQFAGAHNPLYLIRNGKLEIVPADKMEIGSYLIDNKGFTNHELSCEIGDQLYLFSDGFADQFGGSDGKKYKYQRFKEFLLTIHSETMARQKWLLDEEIETWKGQLPQVDDIMVMGVRVSVKPAFDFL